MRLGWVDYSKDDKKRALDLLDCYDHQTLEKPKGSHSDYVMTYEEARDIIDSMKFKQTSNVFGVEKEKGKLNGIIAQVYQDVFGQELYPSIEEKAANFLYLIIKNHIFIDGNKRIAATLFIYFLNFYNILYKNGIQVIDNNTLVAITLLIAQSNPKEKDILVDLVMNFLI